MIPNSSPATTPGHFNVSTARYSGADRRTVDSVIATADGQLAGTEVLGCSGRYTDRANESMHNLDRAKGLDEWMDGHGKVGYICAASKPGFLRLKFSNNLNLTGYLRYVRSEALVCVLQSTIDYASKRERFSRA